MSSKNIKYRVTYFKQSGKYYAQAKGKKRRHYFKDCIYPRDYLAVLQRRGHLPGLASGTHKGPMTIEIWDSEDKCWGYPEFSVGFGWIDTQ